MKTEDLKALGLNDEQVQRVFAMNGAERAFRCPEQGGIHGGRAGKRE